MLTRTVPTAYDGCTVEEVLRGLHGASRRCVRRAKARAGGIQIDGEPAWTVARVKAGQRVALAIDDDPATPDTAIAPERGPVCIRYEDEDLVIVDKPGDLVMYPGPGHADGTLLNRMVQWFADEGRPGMPHAVNRIDRGTTGLVVFATSSFAKEQLQRQLHTGAFTREYLALCEGIVPDVSGTITAPIARCEPGRIGFAIDAQGKPAVTHFERLESFALPPAAPGGDDQDPAERSVSLVRLSLDTGRTHQIRLHMAWYGHPLLGDAYYGRASHCIDRPALHSHHLALDHPITRQRIICTSPLPADMRSLVPAELLAAIAQTGSFGM